MDFLIVVGSFTGIIFIFFMLAYAKAISSVNQETKDDDGGN